MKAKTIILFILGAIFTLGIPSYEGFGPTLTGIALAALCFYFGWRSIKKKKPTSKIPITPNKIPATTPTNDKQKPVSDTPSQKPVSSTPSQKPVSPFTITYGSAPSSAPSSIRTKVVGVTFQNDDGTDRQELLQLVSPGDTLDLEPYTYNGAPAMKVVHAVGCIGNLKAELAADLCKNEYITYTAEVLEVTGGEGGKSYGCNIKITEL